MENRILEKFKQFSGSSLGLSVIGLSLGFVGFTAIKTYHQLHDTTYITVKGAAGIEVHSDIAFWNLNLKTSNKPLKEGNNTIINHTNLIYEYLIEMGLTANEIEVEAVVPSPNYKKEYIRHGTYTETRNSSEILSYNFDRSIAITTKKLDILEKAYQGISGLLSKGIDVNVQKPAYRVLDIENRKLEVLEKAIKNAYDRAKLFAAFNPSKKLELNDARSSVFQITRPEGDATDQGSYGSYDTSTIDKIAKTVVTVTFKME